MNANRIKIDFANNQALKDLFSHKNPGDPCKLTMNLKLVSMDDEGAELEIKKIIAPESYKGRDDDEDGVQPDSDEPAMVVMRAGGGKKMAY